MSDDEPLLHLLDRRDLQPGVERWRVALAPRSERATTGSEWHGAMVLVERGALTVVCRAGGTQVFHQGDLLVLGWLPLRSLLNSGDVEVSLLALRRAGHRPRDAFLRIIRRHRPEACR